MLAEILNKTMYIPIQILNNGKTVETKALIDSGAGDVFIDQNFTWKHWFLLKKPEQPLIVFNVDETLNKKGTITHSTELNITFGTQTWMTQFLISGLEKQHMIFGFPWLEKENPIINWKMGTLEWKQTPLKFKFQGKSTPLTKVINQTLSEETWHEDDQSLLILTISTMFPSDPDLYIQTKTMTATLLAQQEEKKVISLEDLVPKEYHSYLHLFNKKSSEWFSESRSWDHKIEMKEDFQPKVLKSIISCPSNKRSLTNSSTKTLQKDT